MKILHDTLLRMRASQMPQLVLAAAIVLSFVGNITAESPLKTAFEKYHASMKVKSAEARKDQILDQKEHSEILGFQAIECGKLYELAIEEPTTELAFDVFCEVMGSASDKAEKAWELISETHLDQPHVKKLLPALGYNNTPSHQDVLRTVIKTNKHKDCQALATYSLGLLFKKNAEEAKDDDKSSHILAAEEHFNIVREKYAHVKLGEESLGEMAASQLLGLKLMDQLQVGKTVPEISGEDLDGKALKLSDFKGKVTMLSFWATWCQPCMELVPHEIALAESMKDRPFDLVGVNGDELDDAVRDRIADKKITWRSFKNEQSGQAKLSEIWGIDGWPTIFVIDSEGIIRHIWTDSPGEKVLHESIEELVKAAEKKSVRN